MTENPNEALIREMKELRLEIQEIRKTNKKQTDDLAQQKVQLGQQASQMKSLTELQELKMALDDIYMNGKGGRYNDMKKTVRGHIQESYLYFQKTKGTIVGNISDLENVSDLESKIQFYNKDNFAFYIGMTQTNLPDHQGNFMTYLRNEAGPKLDFWKDCIKQGEFRKLHTYYVDNASHKEKELTQTYMIEERCLNMRTGATDPGGILYLVIYDMTPCFKYGCPAADCPKTLVSRVGALKCCMKKLKLKKRNEIENPVQTVTVHPR